MSDLSEAVDCAPSTTNVVPNRVEAAKLAKKAALREQIWAGSTKGEKKLVLLRICEDADEIGVAKIRLSSLADQIGQTRTIVGNIVQSLVRRGDIVSLSGRYDARTYQLTPRL